MEDVNISENRKTRMNLFSSDKALLAKACGTGHSGVMGVRAEDVQWEKDGAPCVFAELRVDFKGCCLPRQTEGCWAVTFLPGFHLERYLRATVF